MQNGKLSLTEFSLGLMAGLHTKGKNDLYVSPREEAHVHACFRVAFEVVEARLGSENLTFVILNTSTWGTSGAVDSIFDYWLTTWVTKDSPGWTYRFTMTNREALEFLSKLPGGADMFLDAADAFLELYRQY